MAAKRYDVIKVTRETGEVEVIEPSVTKARALRICSQAQADAGLPGHTDWTLHYWTYRPAA